MIPTSGTIDPDDAWAYKTEEIKKGFIAKYVNNKSPIDTASCWSAMFFSWVSPVMRVAQKVPFHTDMVFRVQEKRDCAEEIKVFAKNFSACVAANKKEILACKLNDESEKPNILMKVLITTFKCDIMIAFLFLLVMSAMEYVSAFLLNFCLKAFSQKNALGESDINIWYCIYSLAGILVVKIINSIMGSNLWFFLDNLIGVKIVYMIKCFLFQKALNKPIGRDKEFGIGEISNMNDSDVKKITDVAFQSINMFLLPFEIVVGFIVLGFMTGYAILPTTGIIIVCALVTKLFARISIQFQKQRQKKGDSLSKARWSAYGNIKFIKLEALENFFLYKIVTARIEQMQAGLKKTIVAD